MGFSDWLLQMEIASPSTVGIIQSDMFEVPLIVKSSSGRSLVDAP